MIHHVVGFSKFHAKQRAFFSTTKYTKRDQQIQIKRKTKFNIGALTGYTAKHN